MEAGIEALLHETRLALWAATYTTQCIAMCQALSPCWGKQSEAPLFWVEGNWKSWYVKSTQCTCAVGDDTTVNLSHVHVSSWRDDDDKWHVLTPSMPCIRLV